MNSFSHAFEYVESNTEKKTCQVEILWIRYCTHITAPSSVPLWVYELRIDSSFSLHFSTTIFSCSFFFLSYFSVHYNSCSYYSPCCCFFFILLLILSFTFLLHIFDSLLCVECVSSYGAIVYVFVVVCYERRLMHALPFSRCSACQCLCSNK